MFNNQVVTRFENVRELQKKKKKVSIKMFLSIVC